MDAGKLKWRIALSHVTTAQDATGEAIRTVTSYATVPARRMEQRLSEVFSAGADQAAQTVVWRIRFRGDVVSSDVVTYGGHDFEVTAVREVDNPRRRWIDLVTKRTGASV